MRQGTKGGWQTRTLTTIEEGYSADRQGPRVEEYKGYRGKRCSEVGAKIL